MKSHFSIFCIFTSLCLFLGFCIFSSPIFAEEPQRELLWPDGRRGQRETSQQDKPTLTIFLPEKSKANGTAVVICPGRRIRASGRRS